MAKYALTAHQYRYDTGSGFTAPINCTLANTRDNGNGTYTIFGIPNVPIETGKLQVRVAAANGNPASAWLSNNVDFTGEVQDQLAQSVITFGSVSTNSIQVNWNAVEHATSYQLLRSLSSDMSGAVTRYTGSLMGFTDTGLTPNTTYYYQVIASAVGYLSSTSIVYSRDTDFVEGRVFEVGGVGTPSELIIDAEDSEAEWFPVQPNDTFKIKGKAYDNISVNNMSVDSGAIFITNADDVQISVIDNFKIGGNTAPKNLKIDFLNKVAGEKFGLLISPPEGNTGHKFVIDDNTVGDSENITIIGIDNLNVENDGWFLKTENMPYNNGSGKKSAINLKITDVRFRRDIGNTTNVYYGLRLGGEFYYNSPSENLDVGFIDGLHIERIELSKGDFFNGIKAGNVRNFFISDIKFDNINPNQTHHARIIDIAGNGIAQNISGWDSYGNLFRIIPFNRTENGTIEQSIMRNLAGYRTRKYSVAEIHNAEGAIRNWPGISVKSNVLAIGITALDMGTMEGVDPGNTFTTTALDVYGDPDGLTARNMVSINAFNTTSTINGSVEFQDHNVYYANNTTAKVNSENFQPAADSVLKGAGIYSPLNSSDINGQVRLNPPTIGAVEAL